MTYLDDPAATVLDAEPALQAPARPAPRASSTRRKSPAAGITPEQLMDRYVAGDDAAFEELHRRVTPQLRGFLLRLTGDSTVADDLMQITFTKVHRARERYRSGSPVLAWLQTIARRSFYDEVRYARHSYERLTADGNLPELADADHGLRVEAAEAIENALALLEPKQREAIALTVMFGLSMSEAAEQLGASRETVKTRVHRGRKALRSRRHSTFAG